MTDVACVLLDHVNEEPSQAGGPAVGPGVGGQPVQAAGGDRLGTLEEHLSQGWTYPVDVLVDATVEETSRWVPRSLGRLEPDEESRTRLRAMTDEPDWYARQLAAIPAPFRVIGSRELQRATAALGRRLAQAGGAEVSA
jgi:hypothetical protein